MLRRRMVKSLYGDAPGNSGCGQTFITDFWQVVSVRDAACGEDLRAAAWRAPVALFSSRRFGLPYTASYPD